MAITRREFVTRLGTIAAAMGLSQTDLARLTDAFAHGSPWNGGGWSKKPKVVWVHGAECTGCSTSLLGLFEDVRGEAVVGSGISTAQALAAVGAGGAVPATTGAAVGVLTSQADPTHPWGHRTLQLTNAVCGADFNDVVPGEGAYIATIADVLVDFLDLQYHETVGAASGDIAYDYLKNQAHLAGTGGTPYVLVVEGAVQKYENAGYWNKPGTKAAVGGAKEKANWCSIAADGSATSAHGYDQEEAFDDVVLRLASSANCAAIMPIGQCACFGGYPACIGPGLEWIREDGGTATTKSQTGAQGVYDFLKANAAPANVDAILGKVYNSPGCPTNPWWFVLSVVIVLLKVVNGVQLDARDGQHRIKAVYGTLLHGKYCPRYPQYAKRIFASKPGDTGCLKNIGCKGISTRSLCGRHGWNGQQPENHELTAGGSAAASAMYPNPAVLSGEQAKIGTNCLNAGHPCMGCTEIGYPDAFSPFVIR